jgi:hypothetical protein
MQIYSNFKIWEKILNWLYFTVFLLLEWGLLTIAFDNFTKPLTRVWYETMLGMVGFLIAFCSLIFTASTAALDEERRLVLYNIGEQLLHSTLLASLSVIIQYLVSRAAVTAPHSMSYALIMTYFFSIGLISMLYGTFSAISAMIDLNRLLLKYNIDPYRSNFLIERKSSSDKNVV